MRSNLHRILKPCLALSIWLCLCANVHAMTPAEAAEQARKSTGGKVLQVKPRDNGQYRVKVLMPNGQVRSLSINGSATESNGKPPSNKR